MNIATWSFSTSGRSDLVVLISASALALMLGSTGKGDVVGFVDGRRFGARFAEAVALLQGGHFQFVDRLDDLVEFPLQPLVGNSASDSFACASRNWASEVSTPDRIVPFARASVCISRNRMYPSRKCPSAEFPCPCRNCRTSASACVVSPASASHLACCNSAWASCVAGANCCGSPRPLAHLHGITNRTISIPIRPKRGTATLSLPAAGGAAHSCLIFCRAEL